MRVILILLVSIALCLLAARRLFVSRQTRVLQQVFYLLALAQAVMLVYILFLAMVQGNSFFS